MKTRSSDTSVEADVKQIEILRRLGTAGRAEMMFQLSDTVRGLVEAGVRHRHPDYDQKSVERAVLLLMIGEKLFRQIFGEVDIRP
jgi:hypothetical protein